MRLLALLVASCSTMHAAAPPPKQPAKQTAQPAKPVKPEKIAPPAVESVPPQQLITNEDAVRNAPAVAIVRADVVQEECSNMGGLHVVLTVVDLARGDKKALHTLHYGEHGFEPDAPIKVGDLFVAAVTPSPGLHVRSQGWCLDDLPDPFDGSATALLPVDSEKQGQAEIKRLLP
jgi:hypothetical protein